MRVAYVRACVCACCGAVAKFRNTGLERGAALAKDIAWMQAQARSSSHADKHIRMHTT
jgi:hypothetical protein